MTTEDVAAWYFRLNGFFTVRNFVLHPRTRGGQKTDADISGVRFPYRAEFPDERGSDDGVFTGAATKPYFAIAEVKAGMCQLNGPWTNATAENMPDILRAVGIFPEGEVRSAAESLYRTGVFECERIYCSLFMIGREENPKFRQSFPSVPQQTWDHVLCFIHNRFQSNKRRKADHSGWDGPGKALWKLAMARSEEAFLQEVNASTGVRQASQQPAQSPATTSAPE